MSGGKAGMFRRKRTEHRNGDMASASLERAERDVAEQREKLAAELPLRRTLADIREQNHLAEELYAVLSERRGEGRRP